MIWLFAAYLSLGLSIAAAAVSIITTRLWPTSIVLLSLSIYLLYLALMVEVTL